MYLYSMNKNQMHKIHSRIKLKLMNPNGLLKQNSGIHRGRIRSLVTNRVKGQRSLKGLVQVACRM